MGESGDRFKGSNGNWLVCWVSYICKLNKGILGVTFDMTYLMVEKCELDWILDW